MKSIVYCICFVFCLSAIAHEEPAKTLYERNEKIAQKELYASLGVKTVTVFSLHSEMHHSMFLTMGYAIDGTYEYLVSYKNDSLNLQVKYGYSKQGDMISDADYNPEGKLIEKNIFRYDKQGRVVSGKSYESKKPSATFRFIHSSDKKTIEFHKINNKNQLEYKLIYSYLNDFDTEDYSSVVKLSADVSQQMRVVKTYNQNGKVAEKIIYGADDSLMHSFRYTYDDRGNNTEIERFNNKGELVRLDVFDYNEKGLITEQYATDKDGIIVSRLVYEYEFYG